MAFIQAVGSDNGAGATTLVFTIAASSAGNLVAVCVQGGTGHTITDNLTQTYVASGFNGAWGGYMFYKVNSAAGVTSITVTVASSTVLGGFAYERSNIVLAAPEDTFAFNQSVSTTDWTTTETAVTSQANTLGIVFIANTGGINNNYAITGGGIAATGTGITSGTHQNTINGSEQFLGFALYSSINKKIGTGTSNNTTTRCNISVMKLLSAEGPNVLALQDTGWYPVEAQTNPLTVSVW